jgi:hypothetical protein
MAHFAEAFASRVTTILHDVLPATRFYKTEIVVVPNLLTAILITYDGIRDDSLHIDADYSWEQFLARMALVKRDWLELDRTLVERMPPDKGMGGGEGRTYYFIRPGQHPEYWTAEEGQRAIVALLLSMYANQPNLIAWEAEHLREIVPVGHDHFADYERIVRVFFNFLFSRHLGEGRAQARTEPENEGVEIRDIIFANVAESGFWKDLKDKYSVSEVVVDTKNTDALTRDDLRQLYCYLKPALGYWGFIVCRSDQPDVIHAFNRTLFKNFAQTRGLLILSDEDLGRMIRISVRGHDPSEYLRDRMSDFIRSI